MDQEFWRCLSWEGTGIFSASKLPQLQPTTAINAPIPLLPDLPPEALNNADDDSSSLASAPQTPHTPAPSIAATADSPSPTPAPKDPVPLSQAEISQKAGQVLLNSQLDAHKAWIWAQLQDMMMISDTHSTEKALNTPFTSIEDAWAKLHLYHVYHQPSPSVAQISQIENGFAQKTSEFEERIAKLESRLHKACQESFGKEECVEEAILMERLANVDMYDDNQKIRQVYMQEYKQAKDHYDLFRLERAQLEQRISVMQMRQQQQEKQNQPPPQPPPPQAAASGRGRGRKRRRRADDDDDDFDDEDY